MAATDSPPQARRVLERVRQHSGARIQLWGWPGTGARRILLALAQEEGRKATVLEPTPQGFVRRGPEVRWLLWARQEPPDEEIVERFQAPGVRLVYVRDRRDRALGIAAVLPPEELLLTEAEVAELADRLTVGAVSAENVRRLWLASDGWLTPLELALAAGAGSRRLEASAEGLLAIPAVTAFLRGEVFERLPAELASLLLELSAAEDASPELWRQLWRGDPGKLEGLSELADHWGFFLPGAGGVPRLPHLFSAFLRQERARRWPAVRSFELCQQVALWSYSRSKPAAALAALLQAADSARLTALVELDWLALLAAASPTVLRAAFRLSPPRGDGGASLLALAVEGATGDRRRAATGFMELAARLEAHPEAAEAALGAMARALAAALRGGRQAPEVAATARRHLALLGAPAAVEELLAKLEHRGSGTLAEDPLLPTSSLIEHFLWSGEHAEGVRMAIGDTTSPTTGRPALQVTLFGLARALAVEGESRREIRWPLRKAFRLFAYLASTPQLAASQQDLIEAVWGDEPVSSVERNFHPTLSHLRKALVGDTRRFPRPIERAAGIYRLSSEIDWRIDVWDFEALVLRSRQRQEANDLHGAIELGQNAWRLYQGPFLEGLDAPWIETRRERFRFEYVELLRRLGEWLSESNEPGRALDAYRAGLIADPLQERVHVAVMRLYARQGRRDLLRRQYERLSSLLREELRREPAAETLAEYHRLMG